MTENSESKGFSLIELLVVIAIIGILSTIVLAALGDARDKSGNSAVKSNLANARSQIELYFDTTGGSVTYSAIGTSAANCITTSASLFADAKIRSALTAANNAGGGGTNSRCVAQPNTNSTSFVISIPLKKAEGANNYWCVDSSGNARGHATLLSGSPTTCP